MTCGCTSTDTCKNSSVTTTFSECHALTEHEASEASFTSAASNVIDSPPFDKRVTLRTQFV
jgi:hypothetical protein